MQYLVECTLHHIYVIRHVNGRMEYDEAFKFALKIQKQPGNKQRIVTENILDQMKEILKNVEKTKEVISGKTDYIIEETKSMAEKISELSEIAKNTKSYLKNAHEFEKIAMQRIEKLLTE